MRSVRLRAPSLLLLAGVLLFTACDNAKKPSDDHFRKAIDQYLSKHGETCTGTGREFPVDVSEAEQKIQSGTASQMAALEQAGLVHSTDTTAVIHGMLDALRGPSPPQPVKHYEPTDEGKRYLRQTPGAFGQTASFCYGTMTVDSIVRWTEPVTVGSTPQTEVTYTYRITNLAPWAERPDIQRTFGDVRTTVEGISKANEIAGLQLTSQGWQVPQP